MMSKTVRKRCLIFVLCQIFYYLLSAAFGVMGKESALFSGFQLWRGIVIGAGAVVGDWIATTLDRK